MKIILPARTVHLFVKRLGNKCGITQAEHKVYTDAKTLTESDPYAQIVLSVKEFKLLVGK